MSDYVETRASPARAPKQERSQRSFERVLEGSEELLAEVGYEGFTLQRVSERSGVSVGSIYARVNSKDDLVHIIHARLLSVLTAEHAELVERASTIPELNDLVPVIVRGFAESLREHAPALRPIMLRAAYDPLLFEAGKDHAAMVSGDLVTLILDRRDQITHPNPDHAAEICFLVAYNTFFRELGLGSTLAAPPVRGWDRLLDDIVDLVLRVLAPREN